MTVALKSPVMQNAVTVAKTNLKHLLSRHSNAHCSFSTSTKQHILALVVPLKLHYTQHKRRLCQSPRPQLLAYPCYTSELMYSRDV